MSDALNNKDYKFEDGKLYARVGSNMIPNREEQWFSMDEILTKKDVVKLIDIISEICYEFNWSKSAQSANVEKLQELKEELKK